MAEMTLPEEGHVSRENRGNRRSLPGGLAWASRFPILRNPHFWLTGAMVFIGAILHYVGPLPGLEILGPSTLAGQGMQRVLFIIPVAYAAFIFGPVGGFGTLAVVAAVMAPRALFFTSYCYHSCLEGGATILVSSLIILWFTGQQRERTRRIDILARLEVARQELAGQVNIIQRNERRVAAINEVCCTLTESLDLSSLLDRVLNKVMEEMSADAALVYFREVESRSLRLLAHRGVSERFSDVVRVLPMGSGFNGTVAATGESLILENSFDDPRLSVPEVIDEKLQAQLIVPIRSKGTITGTLCVATRSPRAYSEDDRELLTSIGSQIGMAIDNARLFQEALSSEERFRDLFENATVAIFVQDLDGRITGANNACSSLTGYELRQLLGSQTALVFPAQSLATLNEIQMALLQGEQRTDDYDVRLTRRDGAEAIVSMSTRLVSGPAGPRGFQHIAIDVTDQRRMRDSLNNYMHQILTAQEEERKRIARELHDETAQAMLLILQRMDGMTYEGNDPCHQKIEGEIEELRGITEKTLSDLRRLTMDLRPQILDDLGLVAAVEWLAEEVERQSGIETAVEVAGEQRSLPAETQLLLFRICQEAMSNVRRHSCASNARLLLEFRENTVRLTVADDGKGFAMPEGMDGLAKGGKLGILGMSERARLAGGTISVASTPGRGVTVTAELPA